MMAAATPGPVPVPQYPNTTGNPAPQSSSRHARQQSTSSGRMGPPGEASPSGRRESTRTARNPLVPSQQQQAGGVGVSASAGVSGASAAGGRARSDGEPAPLNIQHRVHPTASGTRPTTSRGVPPLTGPSTGASGPSQQRQTQAGPSTARPTTRHQPEAQSMPRPQPQIPPIQTNTQAGPSTARSAPNIAASAAAQPQRQQTQQSVSSSFPHAFERWETLSSRWEGLTGYWISRLEENRNELAHLPLEQQMSRQITDLSAAGANLFHAVVELQRLRASSERKFQRWFFDTRADQERAREMSSELERNLRTERQQRADAVATIQRLEKEKATAEKLVEEMRRELQISREECRRAWEELGRREQEERERSNSLRDGYPTYINGVQVFPFQGVPSRSGSLNRPRTATSATTPTAQMTENQAPQEQSTQQQQQQQQQKRSQESYASGPLSQDPPSKASTSAPTTTAPGNTSPSFPPPKPSQPVQQSQTQTQTQPQQQTQPPANQPFYQHQHSNIHLPPATSPEEDSGSYVTNSRHSNPSSSASQPQVPPPDDDDDDYDYDEERWELDDHGQLRLDDNGKPIPIRRDSDGQQWGAGGWGSYPSYDGAAYGSSGGGVGIGGYAIGWENVPRHHHPTRLSDVVEEEERTQTSLSDGRKSR